ncbi:MAG: gluconolactonase [Bryobacterales bacterium]|nr:gluconolactonase [Bryobacterales bacterium]
MRIVAYAPGGQETILAEGVQTHHLKVTERKEVYFSDAPNHQVWLLDAAGQKRVVTREVNWPHGLRLANDQSLLIVTDSRDGNVWSFQIQADGSLTNGSCFLRLEIPGERAEIDAGGVTVDTEGYIYIATRIGVQVCDPSGRVIEVIGSPGTGGVADVFFAGPNLQWLYVTDGDRIFRRPVKRRGATSGRRG